MACDTEFCNKISNLCFNHFDNLPKGGKPKENEWTVLSCIIKEDSNCPEIYEVVAVGTGSKCIGVDKMSERGDILNDSHAEIVCRRSFLRYLYEEMIETLKNANKKNLLTFNNATKKFDFIENIKFHFFTTQVPCGDASIIPKEDTLNQKQSISNSSLLPEIGDSLKRSRDINGPDEKINKRLKLDNTEEDIHRTGAKCLNHSVNKDSFGEGKDYHITGVVRTKPGRGSPTLSVSCSDKMAKWFQIGIQGATLSILLENPIYLESITIASGVPFCIKSLNRALYDRLNSYELDKPYLAKRIHVGQATSHKFKYGKDSDKQPSPCSILWNKFMKNKTEVAIDGRKQGLTKKNLNKKSGRLSICKRELMECFLSVCKEIELNNEHLKYIDIKQSALAYQKMWTRLKNEGFTVWTTKSKELEEFMIG